MERVEIEIVCNGVVHYRRPRNDKMVEELKELQSRGLAQAYRIIEKHITLPKDQMDILEEHWGEEMGNENNNN